MSVLQQITLAYSCCAIYDRELSTLVYFIVYICVNRKDDVNCFKQYLLVNKLTEINTHCTFYLIQHKKSAYSISILTTLSMRNINIRSTRLWDIECGACLRTLDGHEELVRCIRFDNKRIVSGAYDG